MVNNAGISTFGEVEFTTMDTYKQVSEVNLWGTIRVTKAFLPLIRRSKGKIITTPSAMNTLSCSPGAVKLLGECRRAFGCDELLGMDNM